MLTRLILGIVINCYGFVTRSGAWFWRNDNDACMLVTLVREWRDESVSGVVSCVLWWIVMFFSAYNAFNIALREAVLFCLAGPAASCTILGSDTNSWARVCVSLLFSELLFPCYFLTSPTNWWDKVQHRMCVPLLFEMLIQNQKLT